MIIKETINVKFNNISQIDRRLSCLDYEFRDMHISKSTIKRVDEGLPANAIRGSNAYKKLDKDASPNKGTFEPSHQSQSFYKE